MGRTFGERLHAERAHRHLTRTGLGEGRFTGRQVRALENGNIEPTPGGMEFLAGRLAGVRPVDAEAPFPLPAAGRAGTAGSASRPPTTLLLSFRACQAWDERDYRNAAELAREAAHRHAAEGLEAAAWEDAFLAAGALRCGHRYVESARLAAELTAAPPARRTPARLARAQALLATARQGEGRLPDAVESAAAALRTALGSRVGGEVLLEVLLSLVAALAESGRLNDAWQHCTVLLLPLLESTADGRLRGKGWWAAGNVAFLSGNIPTGLHFHQQAARLLAPEEDLELWAAFNRGSASMRIAAGLHDAGVLECISHAETAQGVLEVPGAERLELLRCRGRYLHLSGDPAAAAGALSQAYEGRDSLSLQSAGEVALQLGLSLVDLGRISAAAECLTESSRRFRRAGALARSDHAAGLLARLRH